MSSIFVSVQSYFSPSFPVDLLSVLSLSRSVLTKNNSVTSPILSTPPVRYPWPHPMLPFCSCSFFRFNRSNTPPMRVASLSSGLVFRLDRAPLGLSRDVAFSSSPWLFSIFIPLTMLFGPHVLVFTGASPSNVIFPTPGDPGFFSR